MTIDEAIGEIALGTLDLTRVRTAIVLVQLDCGCIHAQAAYPEEFDGDRTYVAVALLDTMLGVMKGDHPPPRCHPADG
jgi:hypothetical protein